MAIMGNALCIALTHQRGQVSLELADPRLGLAIVVGWGRLRLLGGGTERPRSAVRIAFGLMQGQRGRLSNGLLHIPLPRQPYQCRISLPYGLLEGF